LSAEDALLNQQHRLAPCCQGASRQLRESAMSEWIDVDLDRTLVPAPVSALSEQERHILRLFPSGKNSAIDTQAITGGL
jgi:hypothetical protein